MRKPRSTRKNLKDELSEDNRTVGFTKIFTKAINLPLIDRYFNCHSVNSNFFLLNNELYHNTVDTNYFTGHKIFEELSKIQIKKIIENNETANSKESSYEGYSSFESESEFY
jgi:hypothetical protein